MCIRDRVGTPTFVVAFTSDVVDIYHVNDAMRARGWRFNGLQYPNGLHLAVTGPQLHEGIVERFAADLSDALDFARAKAGTPAQSAALYGGVPGGLTPAATMFITAVMSQMMDAQQSVPTQT